MVNPNYNVTFPTTIYEYLDNKKRAPCERKPHITASPAR